MAEVAQGVHGVVKDLQGPLLALLQGLVVPGVAVHLPEEIDAAALFRQHLAVADKGGGGGDALPNLVPGVLDPEAPVSQLRLEAGGAGIHDDPGIQIPVQKGVQILRVFRVRLLPLGGGGIPVVLVPQVEHPPVVPGVQVDAGIRGSVVDGAEPPHPAVHGGILFPVGILLIVPHGIHRALRAHPFPQDVLPVEHPLEGPAVALPDLRAQGQVILHGKMQPVHPDLFRPVDKIGFDVVESAVGIAVQKNPAAGHGAAADHLVHKAAGEEGHLVGEGAGGGHALQLVLGALVIRAEEVIPVAPHGHQGSGAPVNPGDAQGLQHLEHGGQHVPPQGAGGDPGQDEIPILKGGQAPPQEGQDHGHGLAAADGPVGQHDPVMLRPGARMPPVEAPQLLRAERLKMKSDGEGPPFMAA